MQLSTRLQVAAAMIDAVLQGTHELTTLGLVGLLEELEQAADQASALEQRDRHVLRLIDSLRPTPTAVVDPRANVIPFRRKDHHHG